MSDLQVGDLILVKEGPGWTYGAKGTVLETSMGRCGCITGARVDLGFSVVWLDAYGLEKVGD